jgi:hypothetical protein
MGLSLSVDVGHYRGMVLSVLAGLMTPVIIGLGVVLAARVLPRWSPAAGHGVVDGPGAEAYRRAAEKMREEADGEASRADGEARRPPAPAHT